MRDWCPATELAGLPGMPGTPRGVLKMAVRMGWESRPRERGKGMEYRIATLPERTRLAIQEAYLRAAMADVTALPASLTPDPSPGDQAPSAETETETETASALAVRDLQDQIAARRPTEAERLRHKAEGQAKFAALAKDHPKRRRAKAREWLVSAYQQLCREQPDLAKAAARARICARVNDGDLVLPPAVAAEMPRYRQTCRLAEASLHRWIDCYAADGIWGLIDNYGTRAGQSLIDTQPALQQLVLGQMFFQPQSSGRDLHALVQAKGDELTASGVRLPSLRSIQGFRAQWIAANPGLWAIMTNPGEWKNRYLSALGSQHEAVTALNQVWEMDSTPGDWLLKDGRHTVVGCIDLWSRRLTLHVAKSSSAYAVGQCFRRAVLAWGVPQAVRTDNGKDYVSGYFTSVLEGLEINPLLCIPFASEQKGTIERTLRTMAYGALKLLTGYAGHNVAEAQAIRSRKTFAERVMTPGEVIDVSLTAVELQAHLNEWVRAVYHQDGHGGLNGQTPFARAASWDGEIRTLDERALDALLAPVAGERVVTKNGLRWENRTYISPLLHRWIGQTVFARYDESDLGRLYLYDDERFLCVVECPEMTGISRAEVAAVSRAEQKKLLAAQTKELRAHKRNTAQNAAELVLKHRALAADKLVEFPRASVPHTTPALDAAAAAVDARDPAPMRRDTPEQQAQKAALTVIEAPLGGGATLLTPTFPESPRARFIKWMRLNNEVIRGDHDGKQELLREWHAYGESVEWRTQKVLAEDFPEHYQWQDAAGGAAD
jgi:putative transposase